MPISFLLHTPVKKKQYSLLAFFLLSPLFFVAQTTLNGLWIGSTNNDSTTVRKDQSFELALTEYKGKVFGYSRSEFIVNDTLYYIVKRVKGEIEGDTCRVTDDDIVAHNFNRKPDKGVKVTSTFVRSSNDSTWRLDGKWKTNKTKNYYAVTGNVSVAEEKDLTASKIFPHLEELNLANDVAFYRERTEQPVFVKVARPEGNKSLSSTKDLTSSTKLNPVNPDLQQVGSFYTESVKQTGTASNLVKNAPINHSPVTLNIAQPHLQTAENLYTTSVKITSETNKKTSTTIVDTETAMPVPTNPNLQQTESYYSTSVKNTAAINKTVVNKINQTETGKPVPTNPNLQQAENFYSSSVTAVDNNKTGSAKTIIASATEKPVVKQSPVTTVKNTAATNTQEVYTYPEDIPTTVVKAKPATTPVSAVNTNSAIINTKAPALLTTAKQSAVAIKTNGEITASAEVVSGRKSVFAQEVNFASDSLTIALYDNGEIDGDTVSIYMNGQLIMAKQGLKSTAIKKTIHITPGNEDFSLVLFADNLGKYPPNTGMLVVYDGEDTYNLRFSSDFQKNAGIVFKRKR
jgi:hypothetical protein